MKLMKILCSIAFCVALLLAFSCGKPAQDNHTGKDDPTPPVNVKEYVESAQMPILAWYSIPPEYATLDRYKELKNAGFTINFSHIYSLEDALQSLELAQQAGVKVMFMCGDSFRTETERIVNTVKDHPALYGYFLRDEPMNADLPDLGEWAARVRAADSSHPVYLNLNPTYVSEEALGSSYEEHVKLFIETVHPTLLSFDNYPVLQNGSVRNDWWYNLEVISKAAREAGIPFWAFALSTAHYPYPVATQASLRLQLYTDLAYGAQCLQYFTYWCPTPGTWDFHDAPIAEDGTKTAVYDLVKAMNKEIQTRAGIFVGCKVNMVYHTGGELPYGVTALSDPLPEPLKYLNTNGGEALVSFLEKGDYQYVMIVNRSHLAEFDYSISFTKDVAQVYADGSIVKIPGRSASRHLDKGDCAIFRLKK
ncbi:MAG: hypothetical protein IKN31_03900 [Bacteroidales bacterium]|nr:hypothetical protein [Bacteroidales bacterium]